MHSAILYYICSCTPYAGMLGLSIKVVTSTSNARGTLYVNANSPSPEVYDAPTFAGTSGGYWHSDGNPAYCPVTATAATGCPDCPTGE